MTQPAHYGITLSVRVPSELHDQLEGLAEVTGRTKSFLAVEALRNYLAAQAWQVSAIQAAVTKADSGKATFANHGQVTDWLNTWGTDKAMEPPKCK